MSASATRLQQSKSVESAGRSFSQQHTAIAGLVLAVVTLAFYNPIAHCGFVYSDDLAYVMRNPVIRAGLTWETVKWAFGGIHAGFWHPLTWLSHALDCQLFGLNPAGHHYVSLLFHTANAILLFLLLLEATGAAWPSLVVAALFALHPENVESVAWAAERKNVLSMFFFLLALWAYGRYARSGGVRRYLGVLSVFALGLMAKPQVITLPCVLLLWDYWPLGRMFAASGNVTGACAPRSLAYLIKEKLPLLLLAGVASAITVWTQRVGNALQTLGDYSTSARVGNAVVSYVRYLVHTLWPIRLAPIYPHAGVSPPLGQVLGAALLIALVTAFVIRRRDHRYLPVGWFWFLGTLVPMIGIVQVGEQAMADRFAYIPMIGLFVFVVWGVTEAAEGKNIPKAWMVVPAAVVVVTLGVLTDHQLGYWHDGETLWKYALSLNDRNYLAHANLALVFDGEGKPDGAIAEFQASEQLHDYPPEQVLGIGTYEQRHGHFQGAIEQYQKVTRAASDPRLQATAWSQTGTAYVQMARYDQARQSYESALQRNPEDAPTLVASAMLAGRDGNFDHAAARLNHAMKVQPTDVGYLLLADALRRAGHLVEAQAAEDVARRISANLDEAREGAAQTQRFFGYPPG